MIIWKYQLATIIPLEKFGISKIFIILFYFIFHLYFFILFIYLFEKNVSYSTRLHLFEQKFCKNSNVVKHTNLK